MGALIPAGWTEHADLVCGFGSRTQQPPADLPLASVRQVHGAGIVPAAVALSGNRAGAVPAGGDVEADAVSVTEAGTLAAIRTADCVPILLLAPEHRWAAAVHAGWRGTLAGIATAAVEAALAEGVAAHELEAAIGPAIGPCCYEVGEDLAERFEAAGLASVRAGGPPRLDLRALNRSALERCGLLPSRIQVCGPCTRCRSDLYWSYRADPAGAGRQLSWIGWASRTRRTGREALP